MFNIEESIYKVPNLKLKNPLNLYN